MSPKGPRALIGACSVGINGKRYYWVGRITLSCKAVYRTCTPGTYPGKKKPCVPCPRGFSCDGRRKVACPPLEYQDCEGQQTCIPIPCGFEGAKKAPHGGGYTSIRACPKGSYRSLKMKKCQLVPRGSYGDEEGLCKHIKCYEGYYQPKAGQDECPACPCGTYSNKLGATSCRSCGARTYQFYEGSRACLNIPAGFVAMNSKRCNIKRCKDGYYWSTSGHTYVCVPSPCGSSVPRGGSRPMRCLGGYYQPKTGQTRCIRIPKGYQVRSRARCGIVQCKVGHYQNEMGLDHCKPCRPGSYTNKPGSEKCKHCPCGTITKRPGSVSCRRCTVGTYQASEGQAYCALIELGYELGTHGGHKGQRCGIKICQPGTYRGNTEKKLDKCTKCPMGSSVHHSGARKCHLCRCGTYSDRRGQARCTRCKRGFYQPKKGQTKCKRLGPKQKADFSKCALISRYYSAPPH